MERANIRSPEELDDPRLYDVERGVPVFKPHKRLKSRSSEVKYEVTESDLDEIVKSSNEAIRKATSLARHTIGHVKFDDTPEIEQPAVSTGGGTKNFRIGMMPDGSKAILADLYSDKSMSKVAKKFPFRSAEYNHVQRRITGVARLIRDPYLDLGVTGYESETTCYADGMDDDPAKITAQHAAKPGKGEMEKGTPDGMKPGGDLTPDEMVAADRLVAYIASKFPGLATLTAKDGELPDQKPDAPDNTKAALEEQQDSADGEEGDEEWEEADEGGVKSKDSGVGEKGSTPPKKKKKKPDEKSKPEKYQMAQVDVEVYEAKIAELESRNSARDQEFKDLKAKLDKNDVESLLREVEAYEFDHDEAVEILLPRDAAGRKKYLDNIRKNSKKKPGREPEVDVLQSVGTEGGGDTSRMSREQYNRAIKLVATEGLSWDQAQTKVMNK